MFYWGHESRTTIRRLNKEDSPNTRLTQLITFQPEYGPRRPFTPQKPGRHQRLGIVNSSHGAALLRLAPMTTVRLGTTVRSGVRRPHCHVVAVLAVVACAVGVAVVLLLALGSISTPTERDSPNLSSAHGDANDDAVTAESERARATKLLQSWRVSDNRRSLSRARQPPHFPCTRTHPFIDFTLSVSVALLSPLPTSRVSCGYSQFHRGEPAHSRTDERAGKAPERRDWIAQ